MTVTRDWLLTADYAAIIAEAERQGWHRTGANDGEVLDGASEYLAARIGVTLPRWQDYDPHRRETR